MFKQILWDAANNEQTCHGAKKKKKKDGQLQTYLSRYFWLVCCTLSGRFTLYTWRCNTRSCRWSRWCRQNRGTWCMRQRFYKLIKKKKCIFLWASSHVSLIQLNRRFALVIQRNTYFVSCWFLNIWRTRVLFVGSLIALFWTSAGEVQWNSQIHNWRHTSWHCSQDVWPVTHLLVHVSSVHRWDQRSNLPHTYNTHRKKIGVYLLTDNNHAIYLFRLIRLLHLFV